MNTVNLYRTQQLAIAAAIESGNYEKASDLLRRDLRTFAEPERAAPERSGTTGHNQTLTAPRKCCIIKAIRRYIRRVKRKQEGKKMKINNIIAKVNNSCKPFDIDDLREIFTAANSAEGLKLLKCAKNPDNVPIDIIDSALYDLGYYADDAGTYRKL